MSADADARRGRRRAAPRSTFSIACRMLPRASATTSTSSTSSSGPSTTWSTTAGRTPPIASRRSRLGRRHRRRRDARGRDPRGPRCAPPAARAGLRHFCAGMRQDLAARRSRPRRTSIATATASPARSALVMTAVLGPRNLRRAEPAAAALGMAMQRTNILRDIDEDPRRDASTSPTRRSRGTGASRRARARRCCASRSRAPTRSTSAASPASASSATAAARSPPPARCTGRSCARSSARGYGAWPAAPW